MASARLNLTSLRQSLVSLLSFCCLVGLFGITLIGLVSWLPASAAFAAEGDETATDSSTDSVDGTEDDGASVESGLTIVGLTPETLTDQDTSQTVKITGTIASANSESLNLAGGSLRVSLTERPFTSMNALENYVNAAVDNSESSAGDSAADSTGDTISTVSLAEISLASLRQAGQLFESASGEVVTFTLEIPSSRFPRLEWGQWGAFGLQVALTGVELTDTELTNAGLTRADLSDRTILLRYSEEAAIAYGDAATTEISVLAYESAGTTETAGATSTSVSTIEVREGVSLAISPTLLAGVNLTDAQWERRNELLAAAGDLVVTAAGNADLGLLASASQMSENTEAASILLEAALDSREQGAATASVASSESGDSAANSSADNGSANAPDSDNTASSTDSSGSATSSHSTNSSAASDANNTNAAIDGVNGTEVNANLLTNYVIASSDWFNTALLTLGTDQIYLAPSAGLEIAEEAGITATSHFEVDQEGHSSTTDSDETATVLDSWGQAVELLEETPTTDSAKLLNRQKLRALSALVTTEDMGDTRTLFVHLPATVQDSDLNSRLAALLDNPWVVPVSISEATDTYASTILREPLEDASATAVSEVSAAIEQLSSNYQQAYSVEQYVYEATQAYLAELAADNPENSEGSDSSEESDGSNNSESDSSTGSVGSGNATGSSGSSGNNADAADESSQSTGKDPIEESSRFAAEDLPWTPAQLEADLLELTQTALFPLSSTLDATNRTAAVTAASTILVEVASVVHAEPTSITLINSSAQLPFTIANTTGVPITVNVELLTSDPRLQAEEQVTVTLNPHSSTKVEIPVTAVGSTSLTVQVVVTGLSELTAGGTELTLDVSDQMSVRVYAHWEDTAMIVIGVLVVVLFIGGMVRTIRRGRRNGQQSPGAGSSSANADSSKTSTSLGSTTASSSNAGASAGSTNTSATGNTPTTSLSNSAESDTENSKSAISPVLAENRKTPSIDGSPTWRINAIKWRMTLELLVQKRVATRAQEAKTKKLGGGGFRASPGGARSASAF